MNDGRTVAEYWTLLRDLLLYLVFSSICASCWHACSHDNNNNNNNNPHMGLWKTTNW